MPVPLPHESMCETSDAAPVRITFVCTGNICRSPMAEVILRELAEHIPDIRIEVDSSGTQGWHAGDPADHRTIDVLDEHGHDGHSHRAQAFPRGLAHTYDLILALDHSHLATLRRWHPELKERIHLIGSFDPEPSGPGHGLDVEDPYYGNSHDFEVVYRQLLRCCTELLEHLSRPDGLQKIWERDPS